MTGGWIDRQTDIEIGAGGGDIKDKLLTVLGPYSSVLGSAISEVTLMLTE